MRAVLNKKIPEEIKDTPEADVPLSELLGQPTRQPLCNLCSRPPAENFPLKNPVARQPHMKHYYFSFVVLSVKDALEVRQTVTLKIYL